MLIVAVNSLGNYREVHRRVFERCASPFMDVGDARYRDP